MRHVGHVRFSRSFSTHLSVRTSPWCQGSVVSSGLKRDCSVRLSSLENEMSLLGFRRGFGSGRRERVGADLIRGTEPAISPLRADAGKWHTIHVVVRGERVFCALDDRQLNVYDASIAKAGKVGFWTKADAVNDCDDFRVNVRS